MTDIDLALLERFRMNPPASPSAMDRCQAELPFPLPADYIAFMRRANGGEGLIGDGAYLMLWQIEELIEYNRECESAEYVPGLFLFASDGGGEAFAFDTRSQGCPIVMVPFIAMEFETATPVADDFDNFLLELSRWTD
jgi:hypothetical protein